MVAASSFVITKVPTADNITNILTKASDRKPLQTHLKTMVFRGSASGAVAYQCHRWWRTTRGNSACASGTQPSAHRGAECQFPTAKTRLQVETKSERSSTLKHKVVAELGGSHDVIMEATPSQRVSIERCWRACRADGWRHDPNTHKVALEHSCGTEVVADHAVIPWFVMHAAVLVSLFESANDGRTAHEQSPVKPCRKQFDHFRIVRVSSVGPNTSQSEKAGG